ncbi:hypothetical protein [Brasilonema sp. UFV-L1]|uniref:hypothetical protein n=1 Tax=Brasilonema sp. UFV-L1 TaxID=2234130 RepID=UPI00145C48CA|nr:hypothetical protein [Brasilonema sp. UFV-L1]NMG10571.1 hypothetical protein [Brasilonema sp. UFV-L1]
MFRQRHVFLVVATAIVLVPSLFANPANAQRRDYIVDERPEVIPPPLRRDNRGWDRDDEPKPRTVKLRNGDIRLPNGDVVPAKKIRKLHRGYVRLPNGDVVIPDGDVVPTRRVVELPNGDIRLPNGEIVRRDD